MLSSNMLTETALLFDADATVKGIVAESIETRKADARQSLAIEGARNSADGQVMNILRCRDIIEKWKEDAERRTAETIKRKRLAQLVRLLRSRDASKKKLNAVWMRKKKRSGRPKNRDSVQLWIVPRVWQALKRLRVMLNVRSIWLARKEKKKRETERASRIQEGGFAARIPSQSHGKSLLQRTAGFVKGILWENKGYGENARRSDLRRAGRRGSSSPTCVGR